MVRPLSEAWGGYDRIKRSVKNPLARFKLCDTTYGTTTTEFLTKHRYLLVMHHFFYTFFCNFYHTSRDFRFKILAELQ